MEGLGAGWVSHGEVVLCWALDEQDGHEHMPDEYKRTINYCIAEDPI